MLQAGSSWPGLPLLKFFITTTVFIDVFLGIERALDIALDSDVLHGVSDGERWRVTNGEIGPGLVVRTQDMDSWFERLSRSTTSSTTQGM